MKGTRACVTRTFPEGVGCHGEEGQLDDDLCDAEGAEPGGRVGHHHVPELARVPRQHVLVLRAKQTAAFEEEGSFTSQGWACESVAYGEDVFRGPGPFGTS